MIYLKNNNEQQTIFIPRNELQKEAYATSTKTYEDGYRDGLEDGKEYQKDQLLNLYVTENGQYEREDGWGTVTVDVPNEGSDCSEAYDKGFEDGYNQGQSECEEVDCSGAYEEGYDKGKNDGYDSGYQDGYNAGQPIKYNTIADIYGSPNDSTVTFKGLVALSFAYGNGYFIMFTDHTGSILLRNHQDLLAVGDECVVTATLRRDDTSSYISVLFSASVEVLSSNNYVVMPAEAVELTNVDNLYIPNENGYAEMKYLYVDGKVNGSPREDFMRLETDASSKGNIGLRGDFKDWVEKLKEGDSIRVYMFTENSTNNFDVKDIIELGTVGGSCNLEDKWVYPSMGDRDDNGYIVVEEGEEYDGLSRVVIDPTTIYNEGIEEGRNQGGGSGDCYHILTAIGGVVDYGNVPFNVTTFRQKDYNITTFWGDKSNAVIENGNLLPNVLVHSLIVGVWYIGAYSFQNMKKLTDITIRPHTIGDYAFANCSNLNRITLYGFSTTAVDYFVSDTAFEGVADKGVVVLYDDNEEGETWVRDVFMTKLPSEWTIEIIKPK